MRAAAAPRAGASARSRARILLSLALALAAVLLGPLSDQARAESVGQLAVEPAAGTDAMGNIRLISSASCPEPSDYFVVRAVGGGFPEQSNAVGHNELAGFSPPTSGEGLVVPLHATWDDVARGNGAEKPLDGLVELTLVCLDFEGRQFGEMTGQVRFTRAAGDASRFEQVGGPRLSSGIPLTAEDLERVSNVDVDGSGDIAGGPAPASDAAGETPAPLAPPTQNGSGGTSADDGSVGPAEQDPSGLAADRLLEESSSGSDERSASAPGRSNPASRTALLIGFGALLVAGTGGVLLYRGSRAPTPRRRSP